MDVAVKLSALVREGIALSRFIVNEEKSQWVPVWSGQLLGFVMDLQNEFIRLPERRVQGLKQLINLIIEKHLTVSARCLSHLTGSLVSKGIALVPVVRLWTRSIYSAICHANF